MMYLSGQEVKKQPYVNFLYLKNYLFLMYMYIFYNSLNV